MTSFSAMVLCSTWAMVRR